MDHIKLAVIAELHILDEAERLHDATVGTRFKFYPIRYGSKKQFFKAALIETKC